MWTQPVLTANGVIGQNEFVVSSGGGADSDAWKAFDGDDSTYCNRTNADSWLSFYSQTPLEITAIEIYCVDEYLPRKGIFQISYDEGYTWEDVGTWEDDSCLTAQIVLNSNSITGQYFRFYCLEKCTRSGNASISRITITADEVTIWDYANNSDIKIHFQNNARALTHYLPFDTYITEDLCGNKWTSRYSEPIIYNNRLILDGTNYISSTINTAIFNSDFTIHFWMTYKDSKTSEGGFFTCDSQFAWQCYQSKARFNAIGTNNWYELDSVALSQFKNTNHHFAMVRRDNVLSFFFDGELISSYPVNSFTEENTTIYIGKRGSNCTNLEMDHFLIHDSAIWTENFIPPEEDIDYNALSNKVVYLPFNKSATEDLCGNIWVKSFEGIKETDLPFKNLMHFNGTQYIKSSNTFNLTGQNFAIECYFSATTSVADASPSIWQMYKSDAQRFQLGIHNGLLTLWKDSDSTVRVQTSFSILDGKLHHVVCIFKNNIWYLILDNTLIGTATHTPPNKSYTIYIGVNNATSKYYTGYISNFRIFNDCDLLTNDNKFNIEEVNKSLLLLVGNANTGYYGDITKSLANTTWSNKYTAAYLPFDTSPTEDLCGNIWETHGTVSITDTNAIMGSSLQLTKSWLSCNSLVLGGQDFTICCDFYIDSVNNNYQRIFSIFNTLNSDADCISFRRYNNTSYYYVEILGSTSTSTTLSTKTLYHFELSYSHSESLSRIYINGKLVITVNQSISRTYFKYVYIGKSEYNDGLWTGNIDEFMIYDGLALNRTFKNTIELNLNDIKTSITKKDPIYMKFTGVSGCYGIIPSTVLPYKSTFTAEFRLTSKSTIASDENYKMPVIFGIEIAYNNKNDFSLCINNGRLVYWAEPETNANQANTRCLTDYYISDGNEHTLSFVCELGKHIKIYCDGQLIHENHEYNIITPYNSVIYIGSNTTTNAPLQMDLFEARFWSKALTEEELFADIDGTEEGLEAWYKDTQEDLSNNNCNLTLVGVGQPIRDIIDKQADIGIKLRNHFLPLKVYLPFDKSSTEDLCGNTWTDHNDVELTSEENKVKSGKAANFVSPSQYISLDNGIYLGGCDFTINMWIHMDSSCSTYGRIFEFKEANSDNRIELTRYSTSDKIQVYLVKNGSVYSSDAIGSNLIGVLTNIEIDYKHDKSKLYIFINGNLISTINVSYERTYYQNAWLGLGSYNGGQFIGTIDEFMIYEGIALHTVNFDPSTIQYENIKVSLLENKSYFDYSADISYNISNIFYGVKTYLPFDTSPTEDLCGNKWISFYEPEIKNKSLQTDGLNYLQMEDTITLGGKDFTIHGWFNITNRTQSYHSIFTLWTTDTSDIGRIALETKDLSTQLQFVCFGSINNTNATATNQVWHHFAVTYNHQSKLVCVYIDGIKLISLIKEIPETEFKLEISHTNYITTMGIIGSIKHFSINDNIILWSNNFTVPTLDHYIGLNLLLKENGTFFEFQTDIQVQVVNGELNKYLVSYLPFDTSPTEDLCGNYWTIEDGTVTIGETNALINNALQLDGTGYLRYHGLLVLGGQDFTIDCWCYINNTNTNYNRIWEIQNDTYGKIGLNFPNNSIIRLIWNDSNYDYTFSPRLIFVHIALVYQHRKSLVSLYINGIKAASLTVIPLTPHNFNTYLAQYSGGGNYRFKGVIDEFRIYNGIARWKDNFYVPKIEEYSPQNIPIITPLQEYMYFNGTTSTSAPQGLLSGLEEFAIEICFSSTDTSNTDNPSYTSKCLVGWDSSTTIVGQFNLCINNNTLGLWWVDKDKKVWHVATNIIVNDNNLHKISLVSQSDKGSVYCDGLKVINIIKPMIMPTNQKIGIGFTGYNTNSKMQMRFYEARFWSKALTEEELFADIDGTEEGLEAWILPKDNSLKDFSSNQLTFTNSGFYYKNLYGYFDTNCDIIYAILRPSYIDPARHVYLPLEVSPTQDICKNRWSNIHSSIITDFKLYLNGSNQFITMNNKLWLGGQDFTIGCYITKTGGTDTGPVFEVYYDESHFMTLNNIGWYLNYTATNSMPIERNYVEFVYIHSEKKIYYYLNGTLVNSRTTNIFERPLKYIVNIGSNIWNNGYRAQFWKGYVEHFHINNTTALHTATFSSPSEEDFTTIGLALSNEIHRYDHINIKAKLHNAVLTWKYYNQGTAEDLSIPGKTCTLTLDGRTNTGLSFYQNQRKKCFPIGPTKQIWIKFDLFHINGKTRFRIYNDPSESITCGLVLQNDTTNTVQLWTTDGTNNSVVLTIPNILKVDTLQTWMLYMDSDKKYGTLQLFCDGEEVGIWHGAVNNGEMFNDIFIQTNEWLSGIADIDYPYNANSDNVFSNIIISNEPISLEENLVGSTASIVRNITNNSSIEKYISIDYSFDTVIEELSDEEWNITGAPVIEYNNLLNSKGLILDGQSYLQTTNSLRCVKTKFSILCEFVATDKITETNMGLFCLYNQDQPIYIKFTNQGYLAFYIADTNHYLLEKDMIDNQHHTLELSCDGVYWYLFIDGYKLFKDYPIWCPLTKNLSYTIYIGTYPNLSPFVGAIKTFKIYNDIVLHDLFSYQVLENKLKYINEAQFNCYADIIRIVKHEKWLPSVETTKVYLPFDNYITEDLCNNIWTRDSGQLVTDNTITGKALFLDKSPVYYGQRNIQLNTGITLGGEDFHISCWVKLTTFPRQWVSDRESWVFGFSPSSYPHFNNNTITLSSQVDHNNLRLRIFGLTYSTTVSLNDYHFIEIVYNNNKGKVSYYIDGTCQWSVYRHIPTTFFPCICLGQSDWTPEIINATIEKFIIHSGTKFWHNYTPPSRKYYNQTKEKQINYTISLLEEESTTSFDYYADITRTIQHTIIESKLISHLTFDDTVNDDLYENTWIPVNRPLLHKPLTVPGKMLYLNNGSYLSLQNGITLGGKDFTISLWFRMFSNSGSYARVFTYFTTENSSNDSLALYRYGTTNTIILVCNTISSPQISISYNKLYQATITYNYEQKTLSLYLDGIFKTSLANITIEETTFPYLYLGRSHYTADGYYRGYIDDVRIYNGVAITAPSLSYAQDMNMSKISQTLLTANSTEFSVNLDIIITLTNIHYTWIRKLKVFKTFDVDGITQDYGYNDNRFLPVPILDTNNSFSKNSIMFPTENWTHSILDQVTINTSSFMIEAWVYMYPTSVAGNLYYIYIDNFGGICSIFASDYLRMWSTSNVNCKNYSGYNTDYQTNIKGKWVNVKIIYDGSKFRSILNGLEISSRSQTLNKTNIEILIDSNNYQGNMDNMLLSSEYWTTYPLVKQTQDNIIRLREYKAYSFYRRADMKVTINEVIPIYLSIYHNNTIYRIPFKASTSTSNPSLNIYHSSKTYKHSLNSSSTEEIKIPIYHNNETYYL